jgi:hypothetical protein
VRGGKETTRAQAVSGGHRIDVVGSEAERCLRWAIDVAWCLFSATRTVAPRPEDQHPLKEQPISQPFSIPFVPSLAATDE